MKSPRSLITDAMAKTILRGMENTVNRKTESPLPALLLLCAGLIFVFAAATKIVCAQERLQPPQPVTQTPVAADAPQNAAAPTTSTASRSAVNASASQAEPDLAITANVTARELRFEQVPNPRVDFTGRPQRETVWDAARRNLPRPVQPGVTYRDIGIELKITSRFADIDRIVAEALGEVPATSNEQTPQENPTAPAVPSTPQQQTPPAAAAPPSLTPNAPPAPSPSPNQNGGTQR